MAKRSLLLVDGDARSLRVLEVSLKKAGFTVTTAGNGEDAFSIVKTSPPDLIISNTALDGIDGFEFCQRLKEHDEGSLASIPFIFLTDQHSIEHKIRGLELGVDEYLTKPIYIKEILTRVRILLQKRDRVSLEARKGESTRFAGKLSDMGVVDLIQTIEVSAKSGVSHFTSPQGQTASLYFRSGRIIDAELGTLQGADAIYRLLTWGDGDFEVLFRAVRRRDVIGLSTQALLMEGMRRLDEWGRLLEQLPPLTSRFEVVYFELAERLSELPDELNEILKLFDGRRSLMDIIDQTPQGDLESLELIAKLFFEGLIVETNIDLPPVESWPPPVVEDEAIELPPARVRPATKDEVEHEPGEEVFDIELSEAVLSTENALSPEPVDDDLPRRPSLIDAAIEAVAPVHPELDALPALEKHESTGDIADDADTIPVPHRPDGVLAVPELERDAKHELGKLAPERRALQMLPTLVEKVRHVGTRVEEAPAGNAGAEEEDPELDDEAKAAAEARAIAADVDAAMRELQSDFVAAAKPETTEPSPETSEPARTKEPTAEPELEASAASEPRPQLEVVDDSEDDYEDDYDDDYYDDYYDEEEGVTPLARPAPKEPPRLEVIEDGEDELDDDLPVSFDDTTPTPLPPAYHHSGPIDSPHIVSSAGQEFAEAAGAISNTATARERDDDGRDSVEIDDEELRQPDPSADEPTVEEPLSGRNSRSSPPPIPAPPPVGRSPFPLIVGVMLTTALIVVIVMLRERRDPGERRPDTSPVGLAVQPVSPLPDAASTHDAAAIPPDAGAGGELIEIVDAAPPPPIDAAPPPIDPAVERRQRARDLLRQADRARRRGEREEALRLVQESLELRPSSRAQALKASLMLRLKNREAAIRAATAAVSMSSRNASAWLTKAQAHYELAQYGEARTAFEKYLELRPTGDTADEVRIILDSL